MTFPRTSISSADRAVLIGALVLAGCGADAAPASHVDGSDGTADSVAVSSNALRVRWRRARTTWRTDAAEAVAGTNGSAGSGGQTASAASAGSASPPPSAPDPGASPQPAPSSGEILPQLAGAQCPNNAPTSGSCGHYGDQCTYDDSSGTHYCTCLTFAAETGGAQGWSCR